jgi:hypothetical protein
VNGASVDRRPSTAIEERFVDGNSPRAHRAGAAESAYGRLALLSMESRHVWRGTSRGPLYQDSSGLKSSLFAFTLGLCLSLGAVRAQAEDGVSPARRAVVISRMLAYDGALASRAGSSFVIAVLFKKGNAASEKAGEEALKAFKPLEAVLMSGLPFHAVSAPYTGGPALEALIDKEGADVLFLCEGLEADIPAVKQVTRKRKVLTLGTQESQVTAGVSLAVIAEGGKLQILIHLPHTREEGAEFSSDLLRVARVLK